MVTRRLCPINATSVTATIGVPTGVYDAAYKMQVLTQHQQVGFGRVAGSLMVDHTFDQIWGLMVVGGTAAWRGGENAIHNQRVPAASAYAHFGYFAGPFVPALGVSLSGFAGHDTDAGAEQGTPLVNAAPSLSLEWSNDWVALLLGASFPYQYDGITRDANGRTRSPWGFGPWIVAVGAAFSPF
jgi:hypothetical protein